METIQSVAAILEPEDFMAKLDLKKSYLRILIYGPHKKYLRIIVLLGGLVIPPKFTALSFRISLNPSVFTKVVPAVVAVLRL